MLGVKVGFCCWCCTPPGMAVSCYKMCGWSSLLLLLAVRKRFWDGDRVLVSRHLPSICADADKTGSKAAAAAAAAAMEQLDMGDVGAGWGEELETAGGEAGGRWPLLC